MNFVEKSGLLIIIIISTIMIYDNDFKPMDLITLVAGSILFLLGHYFNEKVKRR